MPSTTSSVVSIDLASSTVMTPSLPTFSIASAIRLPMVSSPFELMMPICATAREQCADQRLDGVFDAALAVHRVDACGDELGAFGVDGLCEHRRGGGSVA